MQILIGTLGTLTLPKDNSWYGLAAFVGNPFFALLVAVALSFFLLAVRRNWSLKETGEIFEGALPPIASILMVVAAGGVFGEVLRTSGIGAALSQTLDHLGLPVIVLGFIISLALRAAQGSATVAIVTTTGLLTSAVPAGGYSSGADRRDRDRHRLRRPGPVPRDRRRILDCRALLRPDRLRWPPDLDGADDYSRARPASR